VRFTQGRAAEAIMNAKILHTITVYRGWSKYLVVALRLPNGQVARREIEDHGRAVAVLPYDPARKVAMLVRQVRAPVLMATGEPELLEAMAGMLEDGAPEDSARREADEEAGLRLGALEGLGAQWTSPGLSTERMDLYLARYAEADRVGDGGGVASEHEHVTVVEMPLAELARVADQGALSDMKTFALVQSLRLRCPELFE
jgi:nudix-type nucleoside diphosphatase (YffH/AdpP family)